MIINPFAPKGAVVAPPHADGAAHHARCGLLLHAFVQPGASVLMGAKRETVSHVVIRRCALMVYLQGMTIRCVLSLSNSNPPRFT